MFRQGDTKFSYLIKKTSKMHGACFTIMVKIKHLYMFAQKSFKYNIDICSLCTKKNTFKRISDVLLSNKNIPKIA